uniref:Large ribosomal subunit protein bL20c n=1 Tax=Eutreptia sp. CCAC 1914B TaxID=2979827 RepID=A0A977K932_9EUGL|nr:ribosomal protein L20 [Eutreptia sp. CCAC 1914B]
MTRVKRGSIARQYRKKILKLNKGFKGSHSTLFRVAKQQNMRSLQYAYFDRRRRKRDFRSLWIKRINASTRLRNMCYSQFIHKLKAINVFLNRKVLSQICIQDSKSFNVILNLVS